MKQINKNLLYLVLAFISALALTYLNYYFDSLNNKTIIASNNESAIIKQERSIDLNKTNKLIKLYLGDKLIAVVNDETYLKQKFNDLYLKDYKHNYPNNNLSYSSEISIVEELSYYNYENKDNEIFGYLLKNDLIGVKTTAISFSSNKGIYDTIYVLNFDEFLSARDDFLLNFISKESLANFIAGESNKELSDYGRRDLNIRIREKINIVGERYVKPSEIFKNKEEILDYLRYSRSKERVYYTVVEGDTVEGVASKATNFNASSLILINPGILSSPRQLLKPGLKLNITYFNSPITVEIKKENLVKEEIYPASPLYIEDEEILIGRSKVEVEEEAGYKNVLYEETWINGILQPNSASVIKSEVIKEPIQAVIKTGSKIIPSVGTGRFRFPVDNILITCVFGCYYNHTGLDLQNYYNRYGEVYAADNGIVEENAWSNGGYGNYVIINHNNGYRTLYGHLNVPGFLPVGSVVEKGDLIGQIGNTGRSEAPHLHFEVRQGEDQIRLDPCNFLDCLSKDRLDY